MMEVAEMERRSDQLMQISSSPRVVRSQQAQDSRQRGYGWQVSRGPIAADPVGFFCVVRTLFLLQIGALYYRSIRFVESIYTPGVPLEQPLARRPKG